MNRPRQSLQVTVEDVGTSNLRVDRYIAEHLALFSRSQIHHHDVSIAINGSPAKLSRTVADGDIISISYTDLPEPTYSPEEMDLDILYEDSQVLVVNKPAGVVVHPAAGNHTGTLIQGILFYCKTMKESFPDESIRPGVVHRLDKDTSGVLIAAKTAESREFLSNQFQRKKVKKKYYALVKGRITGVPRLITSHIVRDPHNRKRFTVSEHKGKDAETHITILKAGDNYSFVALRPKTGRTHQLRVHMAHLGHPIVGDSVYGRKDPRVPDARLMLHAYSLAIKIPIDRGQ